MRNSAQGDKLIVSGGQNSHIIKRRFNTLKTHTCFLAELKLLFCKRNLIDNENVLMAKSFVFYNL